MSEYLPCLQKPTTNSSPDRAEYASCHHILSLSLMLRPTVSRSVCLGIKHPSGAYDHIFYYRRTVAGLLMWGALSDERTGLSFTIAAGRSQRSRSPVRAPWDSRPYFTVSDLRRPISSPPTTRRITVEVFDPASTRVHHILLLPESFKVRPATSCLLPFRSVS
jgi:hypothetical protein